MSSRTSRKVPCGPYCGNNTEIWRCPADKSTVKYQNQMLPRVRSIAMDAWFNSTDVLDVSATPGFRVYKKMSDVTDPSPTLCWLFLDEREDSINDGEFCVGMAGYPDKPTQWKIVDYPASYHNGAAGFSFVDGHSEIKKWTDPRTTPPVRKGVPLNLNVASANNPDAYWLMYRSTRKN